MIAIFNILADVTTVCVIALALRLGGRYERVLALLVLASWLAGQASQRLLHDYAPIGAVLTIDLAFLAGCLWLLWRGRSRWMRVVAACQAAVLALEVAHGLRLLPSVWIFFHGIAVLGYVQLGCLSWAVLRRQFGPPFQPAPSPAPGAAP